MQTRRLLAHLVTAVLQQKHFQGNPQNKQDGNRENSFWESNMK